ncbi:DNA phosphorothioation-dependent restriction protein DptH [Burkholderia sp. BCC1644]|uniref:DNA phosphorothioation-dependent restriction protein DptH n=1 Tax=Burkholderia sp. BCC1644 TaxID=2676293 RepID=UPI0015903FE9|nr:DNA phosphorothioation-dependent restriction protein DptH [Burkholderia sp. BCC1644]
MSGKLFEEFLAECFLGWIANDIQPGYRYQFKSPDSENSKHLYDAFCRISDGEKIEIDGITLPCVMVNQTCLIPVLHGNIESGFTENYISRLRDLVAGRNGVFERSALLIIHNSMLDTLINSAQDLAAPGAIWHAAALERELNKLIHPGSNARELTKYLLEDQLGLVLEEGATVFGFAPLFRALDDGKLDFAELGLFNDDLLLAMSGQPAQIRRRLDENRAMRRKIEYAVEHYPDQLETALNEYGRKFIQDHFEEQKDWRSIQYQRFLDERDANKSQRLLLESVDVEGAEVYQRSKSLTKAGQQDISLLMQIPRERNEATIELTFEGNDLDPAQIKVSHNRLLSKTIAASVNRAGGKRSRARLTVPFSGQPTFFSLEIKRESRSEEYKFRCLMVEHGRFYLEEVKNCFRIEPSHEWVTLLLEENKLRINTVNESVYILDEDEQEIDCSCHGTVDFESLANQTEMIQFSLRSGDQSLRFNIEGPAAEDSVIVPLLFDQERFSKLFRDDYNAEFNRAKNKIVIDNTESTVVGTRLQLLGYEASMIDGRILYMSEVSSLLLSSLPDIQPKLYAAYRDLLDYLDRHKTLPSLVAWGPEYCLLVAAVVSAYEDALLLIPRNEVMSTAHTDLLMIGLYKQDGRERITPLHPLVLAYHLELVRFIKAEITNSDSGSFAELPPVTKERLVASGLLPFVYDAQSDFAHVVPAKENSFWLEIVPQKQMSHGYVRRLVLDKLEEFTQAYARLFNAGPRSSLILNAINQSEASELFLGLADYFKRHKDEACAVHVNFYDDALRYNEFDRFAETSAHEDLKIQLGLGNSFDRGDADTLVDLVRSRLTYSKFATPKSGEKLGYAHLAFFRNNASVDCRAVDIENALSGVLCDGLIAGEAAETKGNSYFTAFGLRGVDAEKWVALRLAKLIGTLWQPARQSNTQYLGTGIGIAVSADFKELLSRSCDSALWTTLIDPKVTLDFFATQTDVVLIHYSDQYTSSAGYDAITVTRQVDMFERLLWKEGGGRGQHLLSEFNAFNGEWLLKMLTSNSKERKEKYGIIGAYKFVRAMLHRSDISWVPLSVAEMIRVSGNVGLKMSDSEFSRKVQGYKRGAVSDDVLFVGFKGNNLYLLPLEVKTGARPDFAHAGEQAKELKRYLCEEVLGKRTLASRLYRALFVRQVLMQVEKFRLYDVLDESALSTLMGRREWWLKGDFELSTLPEYVDGFVVAHIEDSNCFEPTYKITKDNILQIELPYSLLDSLISAKSGPELDRLVQICKVGREYLLLPEAKQDSHFSNNDSLVQDDGALGEGQGTDAITGEWSVKKPAVTDQGSFEEAQDSNKIPPLSTGSPLRVLFGHDTLHENPLYWEPTNTTRFMNTNTGIVGTMGTGKTQFTKSLITQIFREQRNNVNSASIGVLIFDYKSDYVDDEFIRETSASKYKLFNLPYNPLSLYGDTPMLPVHTAAGFAETMSRAYSLGKKQQLKLENLILECYGAAGILPEDPSTWRRAAPTIEDIWQRFLNQEKVEEDSLYAALSKLARFKIFEAQAENVRSLYDLAAGVTIIELAGYPPEIQNLIVGLTLDLFYAQMQKTGKPHVSGDFRQITKMILVDEADNFMSQDFPALRKILKEGREYGVGVILSTQDITHFKTAENNYASYVLSWVIHRVSEIKNSDIKSIFNKDDKSEQDHLMETIRKLEKHQSLYIDGDKGVRKMRDLAFWELL